VLIFFAPSKIIRWPFICGHQRPGQSHGQHVALHGDVKAPGWTPVRPKGRECIAALMGVDRHDVPARRPGTPEPSLDNERLKFYLIDRGSQGWSRSSQEARRWVRCRRATRARTCMWCWGGALGDSRVDHLRLPRPGAGTAPRHTRGRGYRRTVRRGAGSVRDAPRSGPARGLRPDVPADGRANTRPRAGLHANGQAGTALRRGAGGRPSRAAAAGRSRSVAADIVMRPDQKREANLG
jgi:hypothetical protein